MALDRFVYWNDQRPLIKELRGILEDYLGGIGKIEDISRRDHPWWTVTLPGKPTMPFRRISGYERRGEAVEENKERWFEVFVDDKYVDVMTRQTDEFTNTVAQGFAELLARFYGASLKK